MDWVWLGSGVLGLPVLGLLLYCCLPRLLRWWHLLSPSPPTNVPPNLSFLGARRMGVPVRFPNVEMEPVEPTSPQELLPPTVTVGSFLSPVPTPHSSRRTSARI